jgi:uncharacterized protein YdaU (DUF1376 family)
MENDFKKKRPYWFPFRISEWFDDTAAMSNEECGAYINLLATMFRTDDCTLPKDEKALARMARASKGRWKRIWAGINCRFEGFPEPHSERITVRWLWIEFKDALHRTKQAQIRGQIGGLVRGAVRSTSATCEVHTEPRNPLKYNNRPQAGAKQTTTTITEEEKQRRKESETLPLPRKGEASVSPSSPDGEYVVMKGMQEEVMRPSANALPDEPSFSPSDEERASNLEKLHTLKRKIGG